MRDSGGVCNVNRLMEDVAASGFLDVGSGLLERGSAACANGDPGAFARELLGDGAAKSLTCGRDDGYAVLKS
jgi:hypothetical protein